ncbi:MAG: hypothetical protein WCQ23_01735 [Candidatus Methanomethylophilaceae archaeon]
MEQTEVIGFAYFSEMRMLVMNIMINGNRPAMTIMLPLMILS